MKQENLILLAFGGLAVWWFAVRKSTTPQTAGGTNAAPAVPPATHQGHSMPVQSNASRLQSSGGIGNTIGATIDLSSTLAGAGSGLKHLWDLVTGKVATEGASPQSHQEADTGPTSQPAILSEPAVDSATSGNTNTGFDTGLSSWTGLDSLS